MTTHSETLDLLKEAQKIIRAHGRAEHKDFLSRVGGHLHKAARTPPRAAAAGEAAYPAVFTGTLGGKPVGLHGTIESVEALETYVSGGEAVAWKLAMRVLQSDLYGQLDSEERAECDRLVRLNPYMGNQAATANSAPAAVDSYCGNCSADLVIKPWKYGGDAWQCSNGCAGSYGLVGAANSAEGKVVPDGYLLAPVEPTEAMIRAAIRLDLSYMPGHESADRIAIYQAMLHAAASTSKGS